VAVICTDCVDELPSGACAVTFAVQLPAEKTCSVVTPSAELPSPKSQCALVAPVAMSDTRSGAGPEVGVA